MKIYTAILVSLFLISCAHRYPTDPAPDKILATSNGKDRPSWAMDKPRYVKKDQLYVSGMVEIDGNQSPSKGLLAADLQARANLLSELKSRLQAQLQFATEGFHYDQQHLNNIITESINVHSLTGLYIDQRFYEKVLVRNSQFPQVKYTCYSLATISMKDFREAVERNLRNNNSGKPLTEDFKKKVDKAWDRVFDSEEG
ncbi:MAG: hypothetical protein A3F16_03350 [Deltaproteobacteria bacterium RIFCSPHIGHO2_12_FULL_43_9]|nr:MAG: hypothetical protein A3F16_03350 [Deltaproteobacteria bacterium RIFCSPHIGHO2_12_FULL_43_9]